MLRIGTSPPADSKLLHICCSLNSCQINGLCLTLYNHEDHMVHYSRKEFRRHRRKTRKCNVREVRSGK